MVSPHHLNLRLVRLRSPEEWVAEGNGCWFLFPKSSGGQFIVGPLIKPLASGDVLVFAPAREAKLRPLDRGEVVFTCFSLCLEHILPLFANEEIVLAQHVLTSFKEARLFPAASPLAIQCHRLLTEVPPQFDFEHRSQVLRVVATVIANELKGLRNQRTGYASMEQHVVQVLEKLSTAEVLTLSVGELASRFNCSRRHLNRLFHQHFGFSVASLKMEMRLLKAVSLLRDPGAKVISVAEDCGFNHLGLFNTCFKKRFGVSPGQWRKTAVSNAVAPREGGAIETDSNCKLRLNGLCPWSTDLLPGGLVPPPTPVGAGKAKPIVSPVSTELPS